MERLRVHYWNTDGDPQVVIVEAEDGQAAVESIEDIGRLGYVESAGPADDAELELDELDEQEG